MVIINTYELKFLFLSPRYFIKKAKKEMKKMGYIAGLNNNTVIIKNDKIMYLFMYLLEIRESWKSEVRMMSHMIMIELAK